MPPNLKKNCVKSDQLPSFCEFKNIFIAQLTIKWIVSQNIFRLKELITQSLRFWCVIYSKMFFDCGTQLIGWTFSCTPTLVVLSLRYTAPLLTFHYMYSLKPLLKADRLLRGMGGRPMHLKQFLTLQLKPNSSD